MNEKSESFVVAQCSVHKTVAGLQLCWSPEEAGFHASEGKMCSHREGKQAKSKSFLLCPYVDF